MFQDFRFRKILPVLQVVLATAFGYWGLAERSRILNEEWFMGVKGWDTTARFHVWPWPFKFAVVSNFLAFLAGMLVWWPIGFRWPEAPEVVAYSAALPFVLLLWYMIGCWLDLKWGNNTGPFAATRKAWVAQFIFVLACIVTASDPSATSFLIYGVAIWVLVFFSISVASLRKHREESQS